LPAFVADFKQNKVVMTLEIEPKEIEDVYSTPIIQQTTFWSKVKQRQGIIKKLMCC
jgi:hypothetical protein